MAKFARLQAHRPTLRARTCSQSTQEAGSDAALMTGRHVRSLCPAHQKLAITGAAAHALCWLAAGNIRSSSSSPWTHVPRALESVINAGLLTLLLSSDRIPPTHRANDTLNNRRPYTVRLLLRNTEMSIAVGGPQCRLTEHGTLLRRPVLSYVLARRCFQHALSYCFDETQ